MRTTDDALRWLDRRYQEKGKFATAAAIQQRRREWVGIAILLAEFANSLEKE